MTDTIRLTFPAKADYLLVVRQVAAASATRCDLPIDDVEDARLLVDEAVTQLIESAADEVECEFTIAPARLDIDVYGRGGTLGEGSEFGWTVMRALARELTVDADASGVRIRLQVCAKAASDT